MLEGSLVIKPALKAALRFLLFLLVSWTIYCSVLLVEVIYLVACGDFSQAQELFLDLYCLGSMPEQLLAMYKFFGIFLLPPTCAIL